MLQTKTAYSTAVQVIKPRNLRNVIARCEEEAAIAGDEFYYSWKQGGEIIEGSTVGASLAIARNWGNCAVDVKIEETHDSYIFHGAFVDLETGFNIVRPFKQNKQSPKKKDGGDVYKGDRGKDVIFQIGASKAIRNVVLNAVPKWLTSKVLSKAKENVVEKIKSLGVEKARLMIIKKATTIGIPIPRIEDSFGLQKGWDIEKLVMLSGALRSIEDGIESVDTIFPQEKPAPTDPKGTSPTDADNLIITDAKVVEETTKSNNEPSKDDAEYQDVFTSGLINKIGKTKTEQELLNLISEYDSEVSTFPNSKITQIQIESKKQFELLKTKKGK